MEGIQGLPVTYVSRPDTGGSFAALIISAVLPGCCGSSRLQPPPGGTHACCQLPLDIIIDFSCQIFLDRRKRKREAYGILGPQSGTSPGRTPRDGKASIRTGAPGLAGLCVSPFGPYPTLAPGERRRLCGLEAGVPLAMSCLCGHWSGTWGSWSSLPTW